jgi:hypothetical protein
MKKPPFGRANGFVSNGFNRLDMKKPYQLLHVSGCDKGFQCVTVVELWLSG